MRTSLRNLKTTIRCSVGLFGLFIASCSFGQEHWQQDDYIQESFIKIALEREYKETQHPKLIRWNKPIKLFLKVTKVMPACKRTAQRPRSAPCAYNRPNY